MNKPTIKDIKIAAIVVFIVIAVISILAYFFKMPEAKAADWPFPEPPYVYVGLDYEFNETFCPRNEGRLPGNIGFGQTLWQSENKRWSLPLEYGHNSCSFWRDLESYDALGLRLKWSPWR